jgi:hypothetical protein
MGDIHGNRIAAATLTLMEVRRLNPFPGQH